MTKITVSTTINAPPEAVWELWTLPEHIVHWNFASDDWETTHATNDARVGGSFLSTMAAKDGSVQFEFTGKYDEVSKPTSLAYTMPDGRKVRVSFTRTPAGTTVSETFDAEHENSVELQQQGWQAILNNFKKYVERN